MPQYQPLLISDFKTGMYKAKEPWLKPKDAWENLSNMRVENGILQKNKGYSAFLTTGQSNPIVGWFKSAYNQQHSILVADTKRLYRMYPTNETLVELTSGDTFTGNDYQYFRFANYINQTVITNWKNPLYVFNDQTDSVGEVDTGINIDRAKYIFAWKNRLHLIGTVETNVPHLNRHRWSDVNSLNFTATNFTDGSDAGIPEAATGIVFVRGEPHVMFRSQVVPITSTRDISNPFFWDIERSTNTVGSIAENFAIPYEDGAIVLNQRNIEFYAGQQGQSIDVPELRDFIDDMGIMSWHYITGSITGDKKFLYMIYTNTTNAYPTVPNRILRVNLQEGERSFSESTIAMHSVFGYDGFSSPIFDKVDLIWTGNDSASMSAMNIDVNFQLRIPTQTYAGNATGSIFKLDSGTDHAGSTIAIEALSPRINPFAPEGRQVRLGEVGFYGDNNNASFTASFYKSTEETTPYSTRTITFTSGTSTQDKSWETVNLGGEMGRFHRIKISHDASANEPKIHAIEVFVAPGAPLRQA